MGNQSCCENNNTANTEYKSSLSKVQLERQTANEQPPPSKDPQPQQSREVTLEVIESPIIPKLSPLIQARIQQKKYFEKELKQGTVKKFGNEVYEGELSENGTPQGYGKMYKKDGSLFIGRFEKGKASGLGAYLFPDGSAYEGDFINNYAHGEGKYESDSLKYIGHFYHNKFQGKGKETGPAHEYEGEFYEGNKTHGILKWTDQSNEYLYTGHFNFKNQFHGTGILKQTFGTYSGDFKDGKKFGKGVYKYNSGLRYEGDYLNDAKSGNGIIYNLGDTIAYEGEFRNNVPHGQGSVYDSKGVKLSANWVEGIDDYFL